MCITICKIDDQCKFNAWNRALKAGALGQRWGMGWAGRWEGDLDVGHMDTCGWFMSVQSLSCVQLFSTPWTAARQASLSITNSWSLLRLKSIELVMPSNHLIFCHPLLPQHRGLLKWINSLHQVAKILEFQLQHQSFQWIFRTDYLYYWLVESPCSPRDSQGSSPTPQFKSTLF